MTRHARKVLSSLQTFYNAATNDSAGAKAVVQQWITDVTTLVSNVRNKVALLRTAKDDLKNRYRPRVLNLVQKAAGMGPNSALRAGALEFMFAKATLGAGGGSFLSRLSAGVGALNPADELGFLEAAENARVDAIALLNKLKNVAELKTLVERLGDLLVVNPHVPTTITDPVEEVIKDIRAHVATPVTVGGGGDTPNSSFWPSSFITSSSSSSSTGG